MRRTFEILFGIALSVGAVYTAMENLEYARSAIVVTGSVVGVINRVEVDEHSWSFTQSPMVEFVPRGTTVKRRFLSSIWTHALFAPKTGDRLSVAYLESEPENARVDTWQHWLLPLILAMVGVALLMGWASSERPSRFGFRWTSE